MSSTTIFKSAIVLIFATDFHFLDFISYYCKHYIYLSLNILVWNAHCNLQTLLLRILQVDAESDLDHTETYWFFPTPNLQPGPHKDESWQDFKPSLSFGLKLSTTHKDLACAPMSLIFLLHC